MYDYDSITETVAEEVMQRFAASSRRVLNAEDRELIRLRVRVLVDQCLGKYAAQAGPQKKRFEKFDRVVCRIGGEYNWVAGTIQSLDEEDPSDPTGQTVLPYVVKLDPPVGRLISVPMDDNNVCRAEVCFGHGELWFTLRCNVPRRAQPLRFGVGDRVACAVDDGSGTAWAAGTVLDVEHNVEEAARAQSLTWDWSKGAGIVPYRARLDSGMEVCVHRDVHWLVRDLALQPAGARQSADGTRELKRLVKRRRGDSEWELIDHATRKVRIQAGHADDDDDSD